MTYDVSVIGTGADPDDPGQDGYAMAYRHAQGYHARDDCRLTACADIVPENAQQFAEWFDVPAVYEDYERMLASAEPDVVSVCVPPDAHADIVVGCAESGVPQAIHCEKPMATTWADCRRMVEVCEDAGVQLTFNHQLRFAGPFRAAKRLIDAGDIGELERIEFSEAHLFDAGTHVFDICAYLTDSEPIDWVMGQVDYREENLWFGAHNENHGLAVWQYADGTSGLASTGDGSDVVGCYLRLRGTEGLIEVRAHDSPPLRIRRGSTWEDVDTGGESVYGTTSGRTETLVRLVRERLPGVSATSLPEATYTMRAIDDVIEALDTGRQPELHGRTALQATEPIFAAWESARRRARVDLPLDIDDNPLEAMVEAGELTPTTKPSPASD